MSESTGGQSSYPADVRSQQVAHVYAEALLNAAEKDGKAELIHEQLNNLVGELFRSQPLTEKFLASGAIRRDIKRAAIDAAFEGNTDPLLVNFLHVLNNHDRLGLVRAVTQAYRDLIDQRARRMRVKVRTAAPLTDEQRERLIAELRSSYNLEPILEVHTEPELLGGMIVQVGDWLFDGSVKTRLERLGNQLMASSHYVQDRRDQFCTAT